MTDEVTNKEIRDLLRQIQKREDTAVVVLSEEETLYLRDMIAERKAMTRLSKKVAFGLGLLLTVITIYVSTSQYIWRLFGGH